MLKPQSPKGKTKGKRPSQMLGAFVDKQLGEYLDISGPVMSPTYENDDIVSWKDESPRGQTGNLISGFPGFSRQGLQSQKAQIGSPAQSRFTSSPLSLGRKARPL